MIYALTHTHIHTACAIGRFKTSQYQPASARISWMVVEDNDRCITGYAVRVEGPDSTQVIPITSEHLTSIEISDLLPSTQYTFEVNAAGTTPQSGETSMPL